MTTERYTYHVIDEQLRPIGTINSTTVIRIIEGEEIDLSLFALEVPIPRGMKALVVQDTGQVPTARKPATVVAKWERA